MNDFFRSEPIWGNHGHGPVVGEHPYAPDYSDPRDPQPGEAVDLLPRHAGSEAEQAAANRKTRPPRQHRFTPYLTYPVQVPFGSTSDNNVVVCRPNKGYRMVIRQLLWCPSTFLTDASVTNAGAIAIGFYVGNPPVAHPGASATMAPGMGDLVWGFQQQTGGSATFAAKEWGPNQLVILENQALYVRVDVGGTTFPLAIARVEQFPNGAADMVEEV